MSDAKESPLEAVPEGATRAREIRSRWGWVEPTVWTERMLTALEQGVQGGRWYSLMDKVHPERNLRAAFVKVAANDGAAGVDHVTVTMFEGRLEANLKALSDALRTGTYCPQAIRRHFIPKPGTKERRPLGIPTVRDRVAQSALRHVLEPIFERDFAAHSYGFRPGKGCKDALRRVDELLKAGYTHVVDADLKGFFDTIPHTVLSDQGPDGSIPARTRIGVVSPTRYGHHTSREVRACTDDRDCGRALGIRTTRTKTSFEEAHHACGPSGTVPGNRRRHLYQHHPDRLVPPRARREHDPVPQ